MIGYLIHLRSVHTAHKISIRMRNLYACESIDRRKRLAQSFTLTQSVGITKECHSGGICESYGIRIVDKFELMILVDKKKSLIS